MSHSTISNTAYRASYEYLYHMHHERKRAIYKHITINATRRFGATCLPYTSGSGLSDIPTFTAQGHLAAGDTAIYYCDGAYRSLEESQHGLLASAVAYQDGVSMWKTDSACLPRYSGHTLDAELYALKMALNLAVQHITQQQQSSVTNVVVFSDSQDVIRMLAGERDTRRPIGPIPTKGKWALEDVYDAADTLASHGVSVVVAWVKAHRRGAGREGNRRADAAAKMVISLELLVQDPVAKYDFPDWANALHGDVRDEALWRLSEPFFRWGRGRCWVAPGLQAVEDEEDVEEDWTVYRPIMTLKEAQEEDERELREYLAEKTVEGKKLPRKEVGEYEMEVGKAAPLRHLWPTTRRFEKKTKTLDFGAAYRKALGGM